MSNARDIMQAHAASMSPGTVLPSKPRFKRISSTTLIGGDGFYITSDGRYEIAYQDDYYTYCEAPHPVRTGRHGGYQCPGDQEHTYGLWHIWDTATGEYANGTDKHSTLTGAVQDLEYHLRDNDE